MFRFLLLQLSHTPPDSRYSLLLLLVLRIEAAAAAFWLYSHTLTRRTEHHRIYTGRIDAENLNLALLLLLLMGRE